MRFYNTIQTRMERNNSWFSIAFKPFNYKVYYKINSMRNV